jgi:hypothetical protein
MTRRAEGVRGFTPIDYLLKSRSAVSASTRPVGARADAPDPKGCRSISPGASIVSSLVHVAGSATPRRRGRLMVKSGRAGWMLLSRSNELDAGRVGR